MQTLDTQNVRLDHEKLSNTLEIIREHKGLETIKDLADKIGVDVGVMYRLRHGEGISVDALIRIIAWSNIDVRKYLTESGPVSPTLSLTAE